MKTIRLKGRLIILALLAVFLITAVIYAAVPEILMRQAHNYSGPGKSAQARKIYERIANWFPLSSKAPMALYLSAGYDAPAYYIGHRSSGLVYIFPDFTSWSFDGVKNNPEAAVEKYNRLIENYPESPWAGHALKKLAAIHYHMREYEEAERYIKEYMEKTSFASEGYRMLAEIYREQGMLQEALEAVETSLHKHPGGLELEMTHLKAEILMEQGMYDEAADTARMLPDMAAKIYTGLKERSDEDTYLMNRNEWEERARRLIAIIEKKKENPDFAGRITGRVLKGGKPLANVYVFLQDKAMSSNDVSPPNYEFKTMTDGTGQFVFEGLPPGEYRIGLGVPYDALEGYSLRKTEKMSSLNLSAQNNEDTIQLNFMENIKLISPVGGKEVSLDGIRFQWKEVEGAYRYSLSIGAVTRGEDGTIKSVMSYGLMNHIEENSAVYNPHVLDLKKPTTLSYDEEGVSPSSILGPVYQGGEFTWGVIAYDENNMQITSSSGYGLAMHEKELPIFKIPGELHSKGDRLLIQKKYEEAVAAYEEAVEKDPADIHSLSVLAKLNHYGMNKDMEDYRNAEHYYRQVLALVDAPDMRESLADVLMKQERFDEACREYEKLVQEGSDQWLHSYRIGQCLFRSGRTDEAFAWFDRASSLENGKYMRSYPVILSVLLGKTDKALDYARMVDGGTEYYENLTSYRQQGFRVDTDTLSLIEKGDLEGALKSLASDKPHDLFIKGLILKVTGDQEQLTAIRSSLADMEGPGPAILSDLLEKL